MKVALSVVVGVFDLWPLIGSLVVLPELCGVIEDHLIRSYKRDIDERFVCVNYGFVVVHNPREKDMKKIRCYKVPSIAVWYDAMMSPVYGLFGLMFDLVSISDHTKDSDVIRDFISIAMAERLLNIIGMTENGTGTANYYIVENNRRWAIEWTNAPKLAHKKLLRHIPITGTVYYGSKPHCDPRKRLSNVRTKYTDKSIVQCDYNEYIKAAFDDPTDAIGVSYDEFLALQDSTLNGLAGCFINRRIWDATVHPMVTVKEEVKEPIRGTLYYGLSPYSVRS